MKYTIPHLLSESAKKNSQRPALTFVGENAFKYSDIAELICSTIAFLQKNNISKGDKIALWSANSPQWGITYLAITCMGAVVVPILPEAIPGDVINILKHSESKIIFSSKSFLQKLEEENLQLDIVKVSLETHFDNISLPFEVCDFDAYDVKENDLAAIIYTSGTTGRAKGVMLSHKNISHVAWHSNDVQTITNTDRFLSVYLCTHLRKFNRVFIAIIFGACVYYLRKVQQLRFDARINGSKATMMLSVPLIIEKYIIKIKRTFTKIRYYDFYIV